VVGRHATELLIAELGFPAATDAGKVFRPDLRARYRAARSLLIAGDGELTGWLFAALGRRFHHREWPALSCGFLGAGCVEVDDFG
jgi:hypothetical protein